MHLKQRVDHQVDFLGNKIYFEGIGPPWKSVLLIVMLFDKKSINIKKDCPVSVLSSSKNVIKLLRRQNLRYAGAAANKISPR
ncbi:hypothetical protein BON23_5393 [Saccharomyces cerevisiae]|nr:hypothetical protein BON23_5393 [Saccharomyces cerevisiae]